METKKELFPSKEIIEHISSILNLSIKIALAISSGALFYYLHDNNITHYFPEAILNIGNLISIATILLYVILGIMLVFFSGAYLLPLYKITGNMTYFDIITDTKSNKKKLSLLALTLITLSTGPILSNRLLINNYDGSGTLPTYILLQLLPISIIFSLLISSNTEKHKSLLFNLIYAFSYLHATLSTFFILTLIYIPKGLDKIGWTQIIICSLIVSFFNLMYSVMDKNARVATTAMIIFFSSMHIITGGYATSIVKFALTNKTPIETFIDKSLHGVIQHKEHVINNDKEKTKGTITLSTTNEKDKIIEISGELILRLEKSILIKTSNGILNIPRDKINLEVTE